MREFMGHDEPNIFRQLHPIACSLGFGKLRIGARKWSAPNCKMSDMSECLVSCLLKLSLAQIGRFYNL